MMKVVNIHLQPYEVALLERVKRRMRKDLKHSELAPPHCSQEKEALNAKSLSLSAEAERKSTPMVERRRFNKRILILM